MNLSVICIHLLWTTKCCGDTVAAKSSCVKHIVKQFEEIPLFWIPMRLSCGTIATL